MGRRGGVLPKGGAGTGAETGALLREKETETGYFCFEIHPANLETLLSQIFLNEKLSMWSNPRRHNSAFCFERLRWSTGRRERNCCKTQYCLNVFLLGRVAFGEPPAVQMRHFSLYPYLKEQEMKLQAYFVKTGMKNGMCNKWKQRFPLCDVQLIACITFIKNTRH